MAGVCWALVRGTPADRFRWNAYPQDFITPYYLVGGKERKTFGYS